MNKDETHTSKKSSFCVDDDNCPGSKATGAFGKSNLSAPIKNTLFPVKIHIMLQDAEKDEEGKGFSDVVSWMPNKNEFKVHDVARFEMEVMPEYFNSSKLRTFQKSLNLWGFLVVQGSGTKKGNPPQRVWTHHLLQRGQPLLCLQMKRVVGSRSKQAALLRSTSAPMVLTSPAARQEEAMTQKMPADAHHVATSTVRSPSSLVDFLRGVGPLKTSTLARHSSIDTLRRSSIAGSAHLVPPPAAQQKLSLESSVQLLNFCSKRNNDNAQFDLVPAATRFCSKSNNRNAQFDLVPAGAMMEGNKSNLFDAIASSSPPSSFASLPRRESLALASLLPDGGLRASDAFLKVATAKRGNPHFLPSAVLEAQNELKRLSGVNVSNSYPTATVLGHHALPTNRPLDTDMFQLEASPTSLLSLQAKRLSALLGVRLPVAEETYF